MVAVFIILEKDDLKKKQQPKKRTEKEMRKPHDKT